MNRREQILQIYKDLGFSVCLSLTVREGEFPHFCTETYPCMIEQLIAEAWGLA